MKIDFSKANVFDNESMKGKLSSLEIPSVFDFSVIDFSSYDILPAFIDVHVHFREPGFSYKERVATGSAAGAKGGYFAACTMPNLNPVPDSLDNLKKQLEIIERDSVIKTLPFGAITRGQMGKELADLEAMAPFVCGFSDDGRGVDDGGLMREAMIRAKKLGKLIAAHCEDNSLLFGGYIHDGEYARLHGHRGICSESEWGQVKRDLALVRETGVSYHVCHISTKETVELIRNAKKEGLDVTCETGPHYLTMTDMDLQEDGRFKMNPPIRSAEDRDALLEGLLDGTIDMIATDHAPHTAEEKGRGLEKSLMGVVGIETAFPVVYTDLVKTGKAPLSVIIERMAEAPAKRFGLEGGEIKVGEKANLCVFDLENEYIINSQEFLSMGKATPFEGKKVFGRAKLTIIGGKKVWQEK